MARARMVTNSICRDKTVNALSDFACRLLFTWLITFADREGRTYGDADLVKSMVFPRVTEITAVEIEGYLRELHNVGLIIRYETRGDVYIWFPKFDKNQPGMRKDREPESEIPPPPAAVIEEYIRKFAVDNPAEFRMSAGLILINSNDNENGMEGNNNTPPQSPKTIQHNIWAKIKGKGSGIPPTQFDTIVPVVWDAYLRNDCDFEKTVAEGKKYFDAWCKRRNKDGRFYSPQDNRWLDWWVNQEIPEQPNGKSPPGKRPRNEELRKMAGLEE